MSKKYTEEQIAFMTEEYTYSPTKETVALLAEKFGVSTRSIIGKLSRLKIYQKVPYTPKYADKPVSKEQLVHDICEMLDLDYEQMVGLTKSQKPSLLYMVEQLSRDKARWEACDPRED